jgi:hypothetical protein
MSEPASVKEKSAGLAGSVYCGGSRRLQTAEAARRDVPSSEEIVAERLR